MREKLRKKLNFRLRKIERLEEERKLWTPGSGGYDNLTHSIMHNEGRVEQIREVFKLLDKEEEKRE